MANFSGSALYATWIYSGGTVVLSGDFRSLSYTPSIDLIEATAGADGNKSYVNGPKDGQISWASVMQTAGTALIAAVVEGTSGTVIWGPEGTASGAPRFTVPAISMGPNVNQPYNDVVEFSVTWQQNGTRVDGNY